MTYHQPPPPPPMTFAYASPGIPMYFSSSGRGKVLRALLVTVLVLDVLGIAVTGYELTLPPGILDDESAEPPVGLLLSLMCYGLSYIGVIIPTIIVFCMWMYRAHANLKALGVTDLAYTSGWAAGAWFVPFLNLVRPFRVMKEIWKGSDPAGAARPYGGWKDAPDPPVINWWWAAWLIGNFLAQISMRMSIRGGPDVQRASLYLDLLSAPLGIAAAWLAIGITKRIDDMQAERWAGLSQYTGNHYANQPYPQQMHPSPMPPPPFPAR